MRNNKKTKLCRNLSKLGRGVTIGIAISLLSAAPASAITTVSDTQQIQPRCITEASVQGREMIVFTTCNAQAVARFWCGNHVRRLWTPINGGSHHETCEFGIPEFLGFGW